MITIPFAGVFVGVGGWAFGLGLRGREAFLLLIGLIFAGAGAIISTVFGGVSSLYVQPFIAIGMGLLGYRRDDLVPAFRAAGGQGQAL